MIPASTVLPIILLCISLVVAAMLTGAVGF